MRLPTRIALCAIAGAAVVEFATGLAIGEALSDRRALAGFELVSAIVSQLPFFLRTAPGGEEPDGAPANLAVTRFGVLAIALAAPIAIWAVLARPDGADVLAALSPALVALAASAFVTAWRRLPSVRSYAHPAAPLAVCCAALLISIAATSYAIVAIGPSLGVLMWSVAGMLASAVVMLLVARERYMAAKTRQMESGRSLAVGIDMPKRPLGSRLLLCLSAIPVLLAVFSVVALPWGMRALGERYAVSEWVEGQLGGRWDVVRIEDMGRSYFLETSCSLAYVVRDSEGDQRVVKVDFPGIEDFATGEVGNRRSRPIVEIYLDIGAHQVAYLLGSERPEIEGFCELPEDPLPARVIWSQG